MEKLVACDSCKNCEGIIILQNLVVNKETTEMIEYSEETAYKCIHFGIIRDNDECYEYSPKTELMI